MIASQCSKLFAGVYRVGNGTLRRCPSAYVYRRASLLVVDNTGSPSATDRVATCALWSTRGSVRMYAQTATMQSNKEYPAHTLFPMPALSPTMETGTITRWNKAEGDSFIAGDILCEIETDKATVDFEAQDDGILAKILKQGPSATDLPVGTAICVVVEEIKDVPAFAHFEAGEEAKPVADPTHADPPPETKSATPNSSRTVPAEFALSPSARHISQSRGVDATVLAGTGRGGRITKGDVLTALASGVHMPSLTSSNKVATSSPEPKSATASRTPPVSSPPKTTSDSSAATVVSSAIPASVPSIITTEGSYEDVVNNNMRKVIARRLTESKRDVPHFYSSIEVELDAVLALRKALVSKHDVKVSVNDFVIRSSALALRDVPEVNSTYDPKRNEVSMQSKVDISVAVATPTGLITPIVPSTDTLGLVAIANMVKDLALRARDGKLKPEEYQGGTFCISNLGMFGVNEFSAVINPPQAAILAVGGGTRMVVPTPFVEGAEVQAKPKIRTIMTARLSADRRVVDEPTAALFLSAFQHYLSKPELLML